MKKHINKSHIHNIFILVFFSFFQLLNAQCISPTLTCLTRDSNNNVTYNWNNNGNNIGSTVTIQYSLDGGTTWVNNSGSATSPRIFENVPNTSSIKYRIQIANDCDSLSNIIMGNTTSCTNCNAPILNSVTRSSTDPLLTTFKWNQNGNSSSTVSLQYSINGGTTWASNTGSAISPRNWSIQNTNPIKYRILCNGMAGCPGIYSNIIEINCVTPTLNSVVRSTSNPQSVTVSWSNNGGVFNSINIEYSINNGITWTSNTGSVTSPRILNIPNSQTQNNVLVRLNNNCNLISNQISVDNLFLAQPTQAVGFLYNNSDPLNLSCGSICTTFGSTNLSCFTAVGSLNIGIGTQIYIKNNLNQIIPATLSNCNLFINNSTSPSNVCNKIDTGIRWIRFINGNEQIIWNVNKDSGIITGANLTCQ